MFFFLFLLVGRDKANNKFFCIYLSFRFVYFSVEKQVKTEEA